MTPQERLKWQKARIPDAWPKWKRQCNQLSWRSGKQCKANSVLGSERCRRHGGGGDVQGITAWKRYLLWILLPESIRTTAVRSPVTDQEVEVLCNVLAQYVVTGDSWASEATRTKAIEYLFDSVIVGTHQEPEILLTHLSKDDAATAVKILRDNGFLK